MKYFLVTGAYGGMGNSVCKKLTGLGYTVFALDKKIQSKNSSIIPIEADLTDENSIKNAFNVISNHTSTLDGILHFAGLYNLDSLVEMSEDEFVKIFNVNLFGVYRINKIFMPLLTKGSKILITTSELAPLSPLPFTGIYAITKSALDKYAYSLRMEVQLLGIKVIVLRPGAVDTGMINVSLDKLDAFCEKTALYNCNAKRFKKIVNKVEARKIKPTKIANKTVKIINKKNPKFVYKINRNPLLLLLNVLPQRLQTFIIRKILK